MAKTTTHIGSIPKLAEGTRREAIGRLMDAISASADKKINIFERWAARARLRRATVAQLDEITTHILAEYDATQDGAYFNVTTGFLIKGFDWDKFGDFLVKVLPVILEFIKQLIPLFSPVALVLPFALCLLATATNAMAADVFPPGWRVPAPPSLGPGEWIAFDAATSSATWQTSGGTVARWVTRQECHGGICRLIRERIVERVGPRRHRVKIVVRTSSTARPSLPVADKSHWRYHVGGVEQFGESLRRHLIQAHGVRPEHLSGMSDRELDSLHGHAHEGTMPVAWTRPTPPARVLPPPRVLLVGSGL